MAPCPHAARSKSRVQPSSSYNNLSHNSLSRNCLYRSDTDMDIRKPFSRLKKKFEHRKSKYKPDRTGAEPGGEIADPAGSLSRPVSHVVEGGSHNREDNGADVDGRQRCSTDKPLPPGAPEPEPAGGSDNDQGGVEGGVDESEVGQRNSPPSPDVVTRVGSGPDREGSETDGEEDEQFYSCSSTPSTPRSLEPDST